MGLYNRQGVGRARGKGDVLHRSVRYALRATGALVLVALCSWGSGCESMEGGAKNFGDYLNLRNSFLNPAEVGRFDKEQPFATNLKRAPWGIVESLGVGDNADDKWRNATDPREEDLEVQAREYAFGPGDAIGVSIFELLVPGQEYSKQMRVNELGVINVQNLGAIKVAGLTPSQVEQKIAQMVVEAHILPPPGPGQPGPQVSVTLLESRQRVFSILGSVARPGTYNVLNNDFRLLDAMALAGDVPVQPGMDYIFVIRQLQPTAKGAATEATTTSRPPALPGPGMEENAGTRGSNPLESLGEIERSTSRPATVPGTEPGTGPAMEVPTPPATAPGGGGGAGRMEVGGRVRTVASMSEGHGPVMLAQADLDAALGPTPATGTAAASAPATTTAPAASLPATTQGDLEMLNTATTSSAGDDKSQWVFVGGKWVQLPKGAATTSAAATSVAGTSPTVPAVPALPATAAGTASAPTTSGVERTEVEGAQQRVIRIPLAALREGVSKFNIIVRPGDVINVPPPEVGEFYMMGNVSRPGVYSLTGRRITLKQAVAAAGNLGPLAIPRRCDLIRRIGATEEVIVQVNMQAIFDGDEPDVFLKPYDVVNVGTDAIAPFLAVMRNAYRASYGWGFVYDRNLYTGNNTNNNNSSF